MKKIVIVINQAEIATELISLFTSLFPECEIQAVLGTRENRGKDNLSRVLSTVCSVDEET